MFFDASLSSKPYQQAVRDAAMRVLDAGHYIGGEEVTQFEQELADYLGVRHVVSCSSGTSALFLSLLALGIGPGDEVIVPSFTYYASASTVVHTGATPVFCDVSPDTYLLDLKSAAQAITSKTKAIMPVHLFGQSCDMTAIHDFAQTHNLAVIEDCAQSFGATWNGKQTGSLGDVGCHSFFPTKNLGGYGDGGAISTQHEEIAKALRKLKAHGQTKKYHHECIGYNARLDALQAAMLRAKLPYIAEEIATRQASASAYRTQYANRPDVYLPRALAGGVHTYNQFTLRAIDRNAFITELEKTKTPYMIYYPTPLHLQPCFADLGYAKGDFPISEQLCAEVISLPVFFA
jgi:dTDP-4-amino-4,6-dideoxygalactose transaminase